MICSVAMSTYNGARFLEKQMDSIFSQTRPVDEIVISDDASGDQTLRIIDRYRATHPEVQWKVFAFDENQGFRMSFRRAIENCTGDLILLCDQDDVWLPEKAERIEAIMRENPQVLSLITDFQTIDAEGRRLNPEASAENLWVSDRVYNSPQMPAQISLREMLGRNQGQGCTMALRKSLAEEYVRLNRIWTHDWLLNLIAALHGGLYYSREQLIQYRIHGGNVIGMAQGEHARRRIPLLRKPYEFALAFKYTLLGETAERRESLLRGLMSVSMDKYEALFDAVSCGAERQREIDEWRAFQDRRLKLIGERKLFRYIAFFLTHRRYFEETAYFSTYEQFVIRLMLDLRALLKR